MSANILEAIFGRSCCVKLSISYAQHVPVDIAT